MTKSLEDYLEEIHVLILQKGRARVRDVALDLHVKMPSVVKAITELKKLELVNQEPYGDIELTAKGRKLAANVLGRHTLLKAFLMKLNGQDLTESSITERAAMGIAYAFQQPVRFKGIRVLDLIRIAAGKSLSVSDACEYLSSVGLCARDYVDREVNSSLSGGELKRIEIATVLARKASLTIFDEPEAGIDLWSFRNLIEVFQRMRADIRDSSILIISHQERILNIADEIIVLKDGRVEKHGTKAEIYPQLMKAEADFMCEGWAVASGREEDAGC